MSRRGEKLPESMERVIRRTRRAWSVACWVEVLLLFAAFLSALAFLAFAADNVAALPRAVRFLCLVVVAAVGIWLLIRGLVKSSHLSPVGAALLLERENPQLEHRLINALLLASDRHAVQTPFYSRIIAEAGQVQVRPPASMRKNFGMARWVLGLMILLAAYMILLPAQFRNAAARFLDPFGGVPPLTRIVLHVTPGDHTVMRGTSFLVEATPRGEMPTAAFLQLHYADREERLAMDYAGGAFVLNMLNVLGDLSYQVSAGDYVSPRYHVQVLEVPRPEGIRMRLAYPAYTGLDDHVLEGVDGNIEAWIGTEVFWDVRADIPLSQGVLRFDGGGEIPLNPLDEGWWRATFVVEKDEGFQVLLTGKKGERDELPPHFMVNAKVDGKPSVRILDPYLGAIALPGEEVKVVMEASDDVGIERVMLVSDEDDAMLAEWRFEPGTLRAHTSASIEIASGQLLKVRAFDFKGQAAESSTLRVLLLAEGASREEAANHLESVFSRLARVLEAQKQAHESSLRLEEKGFRLVAETQGRILQASQTIWNRWAVMASGEESMKRRFQDLVEGPMPLASQSALTLSKARREHRAALNEELLRHQMHIIGELRALLFEGDRILQAFGKRLLSSEEQDRLMQEREAAARASEALETLNAFTEGQREVIQATRGLMNVEAQDYSDEILLELKQTEEAWGQVLESLAADYGKLHPQDLSDSTLVEEFVELFSEVELATDALEQKAIELAVAMEESALELAESIEANLERWLADAPDHVKWSMNDPLEDYDVPLAELPEELEDIVGDLLDVEEAMTGEVEDLTSGWLDSIDENAGWIAGDGPISSMSAKGVTGNLLPNEHEVGGRSGEGRAGRSHGQMVEETAQGKGGRQTPTRTTPDPYEAGSVEDESRDEEGGATGGGKLSGSGAEGLRGAPPPEVKAAMDRLARKQALIRQDGEKVRLEFRKHKYHPAALERALALMQRMEEGLKDGEALNYGEVHRSIVGRLKAAAEETAALVRFDRERKARLPEAFRKAMQSAFDEPAPSEYEALISRYYRSLAEIGEER